MNTIPIFNIFAQLPSVYQDPYRVSLQIEAAETLGTSHFDLVVDAYAETRGGSHAKNIHSYYARYLGYLVAGHTGAAEALRRVIANEIRATDQETWLDVVANVRRRVASGPRLFRSAYPRFAEGVEEVNKEEGARIISFNGFSLAHALSKGTIPSPAEAVDIYDRDPVGTLPILQQFAERGYLLAVEVLDRLIEVRGDEAARQAGVQINPRRIEEGASEEVRFWLYQMIEWGNAAALWSAIRLKERGNLVAECRLREVNPSALVKLSEAGDEEARRGVGALARHGNAGAMAVLEQWIRAGQGKYARLLYQIALNDVSAARAISHLGRAATHDFKLLFWVFSLLEKLSAHPDGDRYRQTLSYLQAFDERQLAAAARQNPWAFFWLVRLGLIGHPAAFREAHAAAVFLTPRLNSRYSPASRWLLSRFTPPMFRNMETSQNPHARSVAAFIRGLRDEAAAG